MTKFIKIFLIVLAIPVLVVAAVAGYLMWGFDPNDYRAEIETRAQQQTGRALKLGHLELKLFPWLALGAQNVTVGNPAGWGEAPFARIGEARVGVHLWPLLTERKVEVSTIALMDVGVDLHQRAADQNNWSQWSVASTEKPEDQSTPDAQGGFDLKTLDIGGIEARNLTIRYLDEVSQQRYALEKLNLAVSALRYGEPFDVKLDVALQAEQPAVSADVALAGRVTQWDIAAKRYAVDDLVLTIKGVGQKMLKDQDATLDASLKTKLTADLAGAVTLSAYTLELKGGNDQQRLEANLGGSLQYDMARQLLGLPGLALQFKAASGSQQAEGKLAAIVQFDQAKQQLDVRDLKLDGTVAGPDVPGGKQPLRLTAGLVADLAQDTAHLQNVQADLAGLKLQTDIQGQGVRGETPEFKGTIQLAPFNPREMMTLLGIKAPSTADPNVLKQLAVSANMTAGKTRAKFQDLVLKLDQTQMRGTLDVTDFETQAIRFALNADQLDADRYLAPEEKEGDKAASGASKSTSKKDEGGDVNSIELPSEALDELNAQGTLNVGLLKINGMKLSNAQVKLGGGRHQVKTQDISAQLYGGSIKLSHRYTPGKKPQYAVKTQIAALEALPFLKDLIDKDWISGMANLTLDLSGAGLKVGDLRQSMNGDVGFRIENGAVKGFNLGEILRKGQAALKGNLNYQEDAPQQTDFAAITGSARIINGILKSDSLDAASPLFRLLGVGEINLVNETISYLAKPTIVGTSKGQGGKGLDDLKGLMIPIRLSGSLFEPSYKIDWQEALKQQAVTKLIPPEKQEELKQELNQKLGRELNRLFRVKPQQPAAPEPAPAPAPEAVTPLADSAPAPSS